MLTSIDFIDRITYLNSTKENELQQLPLMHQQSIQQYPLL